MSTKLTDSQSVLLLGASLREDRCLVLPSNPKGGAAQKVAAKLITEGLAKEIKAKAGAPVWRRDSENDQAYSMKLTAAGAKAIAPNAEQSGKPEPESPAQDSPSVATGSSDFSPHAPGAGHVAPREGSKLASVMALLRRPEGATIDDLTEATGWLSHTTRAAITGVRKRGYSVVLDRSAEGASVYRMADTHKSEEAASGHHAVEENKPSRRQHEAKANAAA